MRQSCRRLLLPPSSRHCCACVVLLAVDTAVQRVVCVGRAQQKTLHVLAWFIYAADVRCRNPVGTAVPPVAPSCCECAAPGGRVCMVIGAVR